MIDKDRYRRIDEIFQAALALEPRERASYVSQECSGDAALLEEVEYLLASDGHLELLETPAFEMVAPLLARDQLQLEAGDSIGHYLVVSFLGAGGMGQVYLAEDARLRRKVALKLLPTSYTRDGSRLRRFQQEARAASALNHPNILTIHELGEVNGEQFIATEFVEGETLRDRLKRAPLTVAETLDVAIQIAGALAAAHQAGIVHRDIKPDNIMLRRDGYVKVLDFGLAKLTEQQEPATQTSAAENVDMSSGLVMGTVKYMSPEQASGRQVDRRSDIFSFGVVLYEMIAGRPPFQGKDCNELISAILTEDPAPLSDVPEQTQRLIGRALRKKKEDRYQTIEDLLADLKSLKEDDTGTSIINKIKRHKTGTALGLVTLVVLIAGAGYLGYTYVFSHRATSIAVMPFANDKGDPTLEYLSDGLAGDLIESLYNVPGLEVKALSTVARYKGAPDARSIGSQLNVQEVLFSHLVTTGEDITLRVELVDSRNGSLLWGHTYHKKAPALVVLQSEVARDLVHKLGVPITNRTQQLLTKHDTENADAKLNYLKGVFFARKMTDHDIGKAIELFSQAIRKDPEYARAYAALATAQVTLTMCCDGQPSELTEAKLAAQKAVDLDDELAEGHSALGALNYFHDWDWTKAEKEYQRALELDPNSAIAHFQYGDFLGLMGRADEATAHKERAMQLEPFEPFFASRVGSTKDPDKALEQILHAIDLDPDYYFSHVMAAATYRRKKMYDKSIEEARLSKNLSPDQTWSDVILSNTYVSAGKPEEARRILDQLLLRSRSHFVPPSHLALVYCNLGDREQALYWLENAFAIHDTKMVTLRGQQWKNVENDPRFQDIRRRVGL